MFVKFIYLYSKNPHNLFDFNYEVVEKIVDLDTEKSNEYDIKSVNDEFICYVMCSENHINDSMKLDEMLIRGHQKNVFKYYKQLKNNQFVTAEKAFNRFGVRIFNKVLSEKEILEVARINSPINKFRKASLVFRERYMLLTFLIIVFIILSFKVALL